MPDNRNADRCVHHAVLAGDMAEVKRNTEIILERLSKGDVKLATLSLRTRILEMLVFGGVALALIWVVNTVLKGAG